MTWALSCAMAVPAFHAFLFADLLLPSLSLLPASSLLPPFSSHPPATCPHHSPSPYFHCSLHHPPSLLFSIMCLLDFSYLGCGAFPTTTPFPIAFLGKNGRDKQDFLTSCFIFKIRLSFQVFGFRLVSVVWDLPIFGFGFWHVCVQDRTGRQDRRTGQAGRTGGTLASSPLSSLFYSLILSLLYLLDSPCSFQACATLFLFAFLLLHPILPGLFETRAWAGLKPEGMETGHARCAFACLCRHSYLPSVAFAFLAAFLMTCLAFTSVAWQHGRQDSMA